MIKHILNNGNNLLAPTILIQYFVYELLMSKIKYTKKKGVNMLV